MDLGQQAVEPVRDPGGLAGQVVVEPDDHLQLRDGLVLAVDRPKRVETGHLTGTGERLPQGLCDRAVSEGARTRCFADHGITGHYLDYHPASHFWPLQLVETGILLALAALALALAFRVLRRRTG